MKLHINPKDGKPIYRQIIEQVKYLIAAGRLRAGEELPTVRGLAQDLLINPNTVARAYRDLEQAGILTTRQGSGTFVSNKHSPLSREECLRILTARADALLADSHHLGFDLNETLALVRRRHEQLRSQTKENKA